MRRPRAARPARSSVLPVNLGRRLLPDLVASPPRGGWTLATASAAAWAYAAEHGGAVDVEVRRSVLARCAFLALTRETPDLARADAEARLRGAPISPGPDPLDEDDDVDPDDDLDD